MRYKIRLLSIITLMMILSNIHAQQTEYSIFLGLNNALNQESTTQQTSEFIITTALNDSMSIRRRFTSVSSTDKTYTTQPGLSFRLGMDISLSDEIRFRTGINLDAKRMLVTSNIVPVSSDSETLDTINSSTTNLFDFEPCIYTNTVPSTLPDNNPRITTLDLTIPFLLSIDAVTNKLLVNIGGYFQTPIVTSVKRSYLSVESEYIDEERLCTFVVVDENETSGDGFRNLKIGASLGTEYLISNRFSLLFDARKTFSNVFSVDNNSFNVLSGSVYRPITFTLGAKFRFTKDNQEVVK